MSWSRFGFAALVMLLACVWLQACKKSDGHAGKIISISYKEEIDIVDLGLTVPGQIIVYARLHNPSSRPIRILNATSSCGCTRASLEQGDEVIPAEQSKELRLDLKFAKKGPFEVGVAVQFEADGKQDIWSFPVRAWVLGHDGLYIPAEEKVVFGNVSRDETASREVSIFGVEEALSATTFLADNSDLQVKVERITDIVRVPGLRRYDIRVSLIAGNRTEGNDQAKLKILRGENELGVIPVYWRRETHLDIRDENLFLGRMKADDTVKRSVVFNRTKIRDIQNSGLIRVSIDESDDNPSDTTTLKISPAESARGIQSGVITLLARDGFEDKHIRWTGFFD